MSSVFTEVCMAAIVKEGKDQWFELEETLATDG
jgi:hypothetical protein